MRANPPNVAELSARIADHYAATDPATRQAGHRWYRSARAECRRLAKLGPDGFGPVRAAAVVAALSPRAQWSVNLRWAEKLIASYGAAAPPAVGLGRSRAQAWRILHGAAPDRVLSGPKVRAFWRNLCGDGDAVAVDVWAARAAGVGEAELKRAGWYNAVAASYRAVAAEAGAQPADVQAAVWLAVRGTKPTDGAAFRPTAAVV